MFVDGIHIARKGEKGMETQQKSKHEKSMNITLWILIIIFLFLAIFSYIKQLKEIQNKEQKYVVRYGEIISETEIITEDGNLWETYNLLEERYVRILFDSNETKNVDDDIIIDITEDTRERK